MLILVPTNAHFGSSATSVSGVRLRLPKQIRSYHALRSTSSRRSTFEIGSNSP